MANVDQAMFADGQEIATKALKGQPIPEEAMQPKSLAAGSSTSLYAALAPELSCNSIFLPKIPHHPPFFPYEFFFWISLC